MGSKKKHVRGGDERGARRKPKTPLIQPVPPQTFTVVGIGASAGGLEAFGQLLNHLPNDTGMAFVFVQHLDPARESILAELLSRATDMPVKEVKHDMDASNQTAFMSSHATRTWPSQMAPCA